MNSFTNNAIKDTSKLILEISDLEEKLKIKKDFSKKLIKALPHLEHIQKILTSSNIFQIHDLYFNEFERFNDEIQNPKISIFLGFSSDLYSTKTKEEKLNFLEKELRGLLNNLHKEFYDQTSVYTSPIYTLDTENEIYFEIRL